MYGTKLTKVIVVTKCVVVLYIELLLKHTLDNYERSETETLKN